MKPTLVIVFLLATFVCANAQLAPQAFIKETQGIASESLGSLREIAKAEHYKDLGFNSADEAARATLGEPFSVLMVTLEDLRRYEPGQPATDLLKPLEKVIYPVVVNDRVKSSIVVEKTAEGWKPTTYGRPNFIKLLTDTRSKIAADNSATADGQFVVQVPALNAYFIGYQTDGKLMLASVIDDPALKLSAGRAAAAEEVFASLAPAAKAHNDLPR
jgi:hypothetical protein